MHHLVSAPGCVWALCSLSKRSPQELGLLRLRAEQLAGHQHYSQREVQHAMEATRGWLWHANESSHAEYGS